MDSFDDVFYTADRCEATDTSAFARPPRPPVSAAATKSEFSASAITIDIHLLSQDVDRSMDEFKQCALEWSWILTGASSGGGRDSESAKRLRT